MEQFERAGLPSEQRGDTTRSSSELTSLVIHEFNNYLNGILLQVALLEQVVPVESLPDLAVIQRLGNEAADLVRKFQRYYRSIPPSSETIEINQTVQEVIARFPAGIQQMIRLSLCPQLLWVKGMAETVRRLLALIVYHSVGVLGEGKGRIDVQTRSAGDKLEIILWDSGPSVAPEHLPRLFDLFREVRPGGGEIELALVNLLVHRLQGNIHINNRPEGGVTFRVELTRAEAAGP